MNETLLSVEEPLVASAPLALEWSVKECEPEQGGAPAVPDTPGTPNRQGSVRWRVHAVKV